MWMMRYVVLTAPPNSKFLNSAKPQSSLLKPNHVAHKKLILVHVAATNPPLPLRATTCNRVPPPPPLFALPSRLSSKANYPTDLTCAFLGAVLCCALSDVWALGKLCSLGTYAARLEEEWRLAPHEPSVPPAMTDPLRDV